MPGFFGLTNDYIHNVYEQFFYLKQHGNWGFWEAYNLPVKMRVWFAQKLSKYHEEQNKAMERQSRKSKR